MLSHVTRGISLNIFYLEHFPSPLAADPINLENVMSHVSGVINENETRTDRMCMSVTVIMA